VNFKVALEKYIRVFRGFKVIRGPHFGNRCSNLWLPNPRLAK